MNIEPGGKYLTKRLASLDVMRGISILAMIPFHILMFAMVMWGGSIDELLGFMGQGGSGSLWLVVALGAPLATGLITFFFVSGMSLAISMARRSRTQSLSALIRHVVARYGGYVLAGFLFEFIIWIGLFQVELSLETLPAIIFGATFGAPLIGIGLTCLAAFPFVLRLTWKELLGVAIILALVIAAVLYGVLLPVAEALPPYTPLTFLLTGGFSVLKCLPMVFVGAAVGKLVLMGREVLKTSLLVGGVVTTIYMIIPALYGSGGMHIVFAYWAYPHAFLFVVGSGLLMYGMFRALELRGYSLAPLRIFGRSSLLVYYGHFILFFILFQLIGPQNITGGVMGGLMIGVIIAIWIISYAYSRWRWGSPYTW